MVTLVTHLTIVDYPSRMELVAIILFLLVSVTKASENTPGTPGAVWSDEEVHIVRLKILELLALDEAKMDEMFPNEEFSAQERSGHPVTELALFRLSFHDCLAYEDGSPGCKIMQMSIYYINTLFGIGYSEV